MKKTYNITITVEIPYPKEFTYRMEATAVHVAVARAFKELKKQVGRKIIREWKIRVACLGASSARMLTTNHDEQE